MIVQYESQKRSFTWIVGKHNAQGSDGAFVDNTGGDFDVAPELLELLDEDEESGRFGFRLQQ